MKTIMVTSTKPYTGKSGIALSLIGLLADRGHDVGYFKPYGTMPVTVDGAVTDADAHYINRVLPKPSPCSAVCPVVRTQTFVEDVLAGGAGDAVAAVRQAFVTCAEDRDVMVVEGPTTPSQGGCVGLTAHDIADMFDARVVLVDRPRPTDLPDEAAAEGSAFGGRLAGIIFNGVHESRLATTRERIAPFFESRGLAVLGVLAYDSSLGSVTVAEIVDALSGVVLTAHDRLGDTIETFMVGAMGQDKALKFFRRKVNKAVITGGDRADVQLAALETSTRCIVLTGSMPPGPAVMARAEELGVPMVLVDTDTLTAVERMDALLGHVRLHDPDKAARIRALFERDVDTQRLLSVVGLD